MEGMLYSRLDLQGWLAGNEYEALIGAAAGIADEYEAQHGTLPEPFWSDLQAAAEQMGEAGLLAPFVEGGTAQSTFLQRTRGGISAR